MRCAPATVILTNYLFFLVMFTEITEALPEKTLSRKKRLIVWEPWGISWVQLVAGIGLPIEVQDQSITIGSVFKAYYLLPNNASYLTRPSVTLLRKKRAATTRWMLYEVFEKYMETFGYGDGKACLLRSICEASQAPFESKSGLLAEIMHVILTPSSTSETIDSHSDTKYHAAEQLGKEVKNCEILFPECTVNFMSQFTRFLF